MLGAEAGPQTRAGAERLLQQFKPQLRSDARTRAFRKFVLEATPASLAEVPVQKLLMWAAVDLMPDFARAMHGLRRPLMLVRAPTFGIASILRWAFAAENYR